MVKMVNFIMCIQPQLKKYKKQAFVPIRVYRILDSLPREATFLCCTYLEMTTAKNTSKWVRTTMPVYVYSDFKGVTPTRENMG